MKPSSMRQRAARGTALILMTALLAACTSIPTEHLPRGNDLPLLGDDPVLAGKPYRIQPGDKLDIKFFYTKDLSESAVVRPDGFITLPLVDEVKAAGLTPQQLDDLLTVSYAQHVNNPVLSVILREYAGFGAYIGGEVVAPRIIPLNGGMTPMQALSFAGGVKTTAHMKSVLLIRKAEDGRPVPHVLDLSDEALAHGSRDMRIALQPSDVIYIPRSPIANANLFVQQYITDLILFKGINIGFTTNYIYNKDNGNGFVTP